ncbi:uncharacterized protein LOC110807829 [Carica papaya]|uniref:uncharacterized protein LOC110807829 n=1 Tax=Carica papaya TaxID=3649 RepID=UPI000B8C8E9D|nr:uncharacterized protein LOC110807829 [Carica papaya]
MRLEGICFTIQLAIRASTAKPIHPARVQPVVMFDTVQEIAIYLHRFHNLDLFHQGWYQIKITMRWEEDERIPCGTPSRVVQYEAHDLGSDEAHGIWRIDDKENSFFTQPFWIKYARQDIRLCMMVSFNIPLDKYQGRSTSAVILKFELMYASAMDNMLLGSLEACPASVHEFRIPPKALLGVHSYCPVHFDAYHAVLFDLSVHVTLLKSASYTQLEKVPSDSSEAEDSNGDTVDGSNHAPGRGASLDRKRVMCVKALLDARNTLLEELQKLSNALDHAIDLSAFISQMNEMFVSVLPPNLAAQLGEVSGQGKPQNSLERESGTLDFPSDLILHRLSKDDLFNIFHLLGGQNLYLWNTFLTFHRDNKSKIMGYLRDVWARDRRAEWSIWMVYSKVEMPHHYINSGADESSHRGMHRRVSSLWKINDPAQAATMRAELHRRSIAQMKINNRSVQDMHVFGDPSRIPIVIMERVLNAPRRTFSENSYFRHLDLVDSSLLTGPGPESGKKQSGSSKQQTGRELKIVVFVHGFQGHHLDLRLVRNQWLLIDPKIEFLMSEVNEDKTYGDFREMGQRLAQEVISFMKRKMDKFSRTGRLRNIKLSFVGHSIGNVIIRAALVDNAMEPYLRFLYTYISLSGPHLGYLYSSNSLFNSGLWLLKKLKGTQCIHQLTLTDDPDLRKTFFYTLCKQKTLENFKHIILVSSPQVFLLILWIHLM